jgi:hypothetical protein
MSDEHAGDLDEIIRRFETAWGRPLTAQERADFAKAHEENAPQRELFRLAHNPMARARATLDFMRRLKKRQGTIMPDFDALYRRKAELDDPRP